MVENLEKPNPMCAKRPYIPLQIGYIFNVISNKCDIDSLSKISKSSLDHLPEKRPELPRVLVETNKNKGN